MYVWIYENGAEEFESHHPYFTLISLFLKAAFKSRKRRKIEKGRQWKKDTQVEKERKKTDLPLNFYIVTFGLRPEFSSLTPFSKIQPYVKKNIYCERGLFVPSRQAWLRLTGNFELRRENILIPSFLRRFEKWQIQLENSSKDLLNLSFILSELSGKDWYLCFSGYHVCTLLHNGPFVFPRSNTHCQISTRNKKHCLFSNISNRIKSWPETPHSSDRIWGKTLCGEHRMLLPSAFQFRRVFWAQ